MLVYGSLITAQILQFASRTIIEMRSMVAFLYHLLKVYLCRVFGINLFTLNNWHTSNDDIRLCVPSSEITKNGFLAQTW